MKKRAHFLLVTLMAGQLTLVSTEAQFSDWANDVSNRISYASGGSNYLIGHATDYNQGCFAQLIYAGPDGEIDSAIVSGDGTSGDDEVAAKAWVGRYVFSSPHGRLYGGGYSGGAEGELYYVRLWTAPSADYANGIVPICPSNFYGDSALKSYPVPPAPPEIFDFGGSTGFSTVLKPLIVDSDMNGLPDWWEYTYFQVFTNTDPWADADTDTVANIDEYYAGTDPTNAWSVLAIDDIGMEGSSGRILRWPAESRQLYSLERGTNDYTAANRPFSFNVVTNNLQTADGWLSFTDRVEGVGPYFYRVTTTVFTNW